MALGLDLQTLEERVQYVNPFQVERGGILSLTTLSGVQYAVYEPNPNETTVPIGLQLHDQEEVDLYRAVPPWNWRRAYPEFTPFPYMTKGNVITNAIHPDADSGLIRVGQPFYLAPSGLITTTTRYSSRKIGTFQSNLNQYGLAVPGPLAPTLFRAAGNEAIVNPDPALVLTAGWAKVRINL